MGRTRLRVVSACLAIVGAAAIVSGGGAANRDAVVTFDAVPGPVRVTSGQAVAYTSTFQHLSKSTFTHVEFHMTVPTATVGSTTYQATLAASSCEATIHAGELVCGFDNVRSGSPPIVVTVVWQTPLIGACDGCLTSTGTLVDQGTRQRHQRPQRHLPGQRHNRRRDTTRGRRPE